MEVFYVSTKGSAQITYTQALISIVYDKSMPTNLNTSIKKIIYKKIDFSIFVTAEKRDPTVIFVYLLVYTYKRLFIGERGENEHIVLLVSILIYCSFIGNRGTRLLYLLVYTYIASS